jgi:flagellar hook-basal body complex protein FliE
MPMSRAEAVCACRNILEAVESLDETLPGTYSTSVHDKIKSMSEYIERTPQYPTVTEKMDAAIRNTWAGLQKWNHKGEANADLFYGLADVIGELSSPAVAAEPDEEAAGMAAEVNPESAADFETTMREMLGEPTEEQRRSLAQMSEAAKGKTSVVRAVVKARGEPLTTIVIAGPSVPSAELPPTVAFVRAKFLQLAAKARENVIAVIRTRYRERGVNVLDLDKIKHGDLTPVLRLTTSERTRQCLEAAFTAGYISGAKSTIEELEEQLRKNAS